MKNNLKVQTTLDTAKLEPMNETSDIFWAGGQHPRMTFHKKKDEIVKWTEVLFRN